VIDHQVYFEALTELGYESFSVEPDGTVWTGKFEDKTFVDPEIVSAKVAEVEARKQ
jgi:hypothetical protein